MDEMDEILLDAFIQEQEKGNRVEGTWTTQAYANIVKLCNEKFAFPIDKEHVKNRVRTLKANFGLCHDMFHGSSGFAWNIVTKLFEAEPQVWKDRIEVTFLVIYIPSFIKHFYNSITNYEKCYVINIQFIYAG